MEFEAKNDHIVLHFKGQKLTKDIKSLFSMTEAEYKNETAVIAYSKIADLNSYEIKKLGLPPVYPHRLEIQTSGRPTTSAFQAKIKYIDQKSRIFYQTKRTGVILDLNGKKFTLTNPHFTFLENLEKLSPNIRRPDKRLHIWSQIIKVIPKECELENKELLNFSFIKANQFCLDQKLLHDNEFKIVPELIYTDKDEEEDKSFTHQLPQGISQEFKEEFLKTNGVDSYYKVGSYYLKLSKALKVCLKIIKQINEKPLQTRRAFYLNPMEKIKKELPEDVSEDLLEDIFFETDHFKSDRISHIGKWIPKLGVYTDPDSKNPWFPKDDISFKIEDKLFHFHPDDLETVIKNLEQNQKQGKEGLIYKNQFIPVNDEVIFKIKNVIQNIMEEYKSLAPTSYKNKQKLSKLVAVIKDNIDTKIYEGTINKRQNLVKGVPSDLKYKFTKYPHQKEGLLWLQENFICGVPGVLLSDDMGIGKTFQSLAFLHWYRKTTRNKKPILIVAPTGLLKNWQDENEKHLLNYGGLGRKYKAYSGSFRKNRNSFTVSSVVEDMEKSDWVLTTYETVRDHHKDFFIRISWGIIIFDEIQKVKNPNSLMTDASKALKSDFSIGLTGTPVENSFLDLWCISDCLYPKILGTLEDFRKRYIKNKSDGKEIQDRLSQKKPPFVLRRMKKDVISSLPKKTVISEKITMTKEQADIYSEIMRKTKAHEYSTSLQALSLMKKISIYTQDCFEGSDEEFIQSSSKLQFCFKTLENIKSKNEKTLISIENRNLQKKIKGICFSKWNLKIDIINGDMSGENRQKTVNKFNASPEKFNIMVISPKAGGVGLNIASANHIIHLERWWNPAVEDQCTDRIFRIGQNKPVYIYCPLAFHPEYKENSFDIVLNNLLEKKRKMRENTLIVSEPDNHEKNDLYRKVTNGEEMYGSHEESFYNSEGWKVLRKKAFQKYPSICMRCGNKDFLEVDHVKPRSRYPDLELDIDNLQILCRDCNLSKGVKDSPNWDFRQKRSLDK